MGKYIKDNFLLDNEIAVKLYNDYAKTMPIFDYHCHLSVKDIYENRKFKNITEVWLVDNNYGDHYKWRLMRALGVNEEYITGNRPDIEKFIKWAEVVPYTIGNPLYNWTHMELSFFFGIEKELNSDTASEIYEECNKQLKDMGTREMILKSNVKIICTTDDPTDDLRYHKLLKDDKSFPVTVLPAFRPDKLININSDLFRDYFNKFNSINNGSIHTFNDYLQAIISRIDYFDQVGCKLSDHAFDNVSYIEASIEEVSIIFNKALEEKPLTSIEISKYKTFMYSFLAKEYHKRSWVQQYHINALRNANVQMYQTIGPDSGFDAMNDKEIANDVQQLFSYLDSTNQLPKTILYSLNPKDNETLEALGGCFQKDVKGKIQLGAAWWFNDQKDGILKQMNTLANMGLISTFVGMLTDSRCFLSYPRHDYFRRILCSFFGKLIESGEYPNHLDFVGKIVQDISFNNAYNYFELHE